MRPRRVGHHGVLRATRPGRLRWMVALSCALHGVLVIGGGAFFSSNAKSAPLLDRDVYMVSAVVLPKADDLPDKASAPKPPDPGEASEAAIEAPIEPDRMVLNERKKQKEGPTPAKKQPKTKREKTKREKTKRPSMAELLARVNDESDELRFETDPEGQDGAKPSALKARFGKRLTPYQRRIKDIIQANWFAKSSSGQPARSLWAVISFDIDEQGRIGRPAIQEGSGDYVYDQSCFRAVRRTGTLPPPPAGEARLVSVGFSPRDKE